MATKCNDMNEFTHSVVLGDVHVQCSNEDHRDHEGEEEHDQDGVDDAEPVHLVRHRAVHRQIDVPTRRPVNLYWYKKSTYAR